MLEQVTTFKEKGFFMFCFGVKDSVDVYSKAASKLFDIV